MTEMNVLRPNYSMSGNGLLVYDINDHKYIALDTTSSGRVIQIRLMDTMAGGDCCVSRFVPVGVMYDHEITCEVDTGSYVEYFALDLDALTYMEDHFQEVC